MNVDEVITMNLEDDPAENSDYWDYMLSLLYNDNVSYTSPFKEVNEMLLSLHNQISGRDDTIEDVINEFTHDK